MSDDRQEQCQRKRRPLARKFEELIQNQDRWRVNFTLLARISRLGQDLKLNFASEGERDRPQARFFRRLRKTKNRQRGLPVEESIFADQALTKRRRNTSTAPKPSASKIIVVAPSGTVLVPAFTGCEISWFHAWDQ